jgi:hypothetical protein
MACGESALFGSACWSWLTTGMPLLQTRRNMGQVDARPGDSVVRPAAASCEFGASTLPLPVGSSFHRIIARLLRQARLGLALLAPPLVDHHSRFGGTVLHGRRVSLDSRFTRSQSMCQQLPLCSASERLGHETFYWHQNRLPRVPNKVLA